jgi:hypothetical protein
MVAPVELTLVSTSGPGFGKTTSVVSIVVQPLLRFARKIPGREENEVSARLPVADPPTVTEAQFI